MNNIRTVKQLIKLAKSLISSMDEEEQFDDEEYVQNVKKDDGFCAIGIMKRNHNEYVITSGDDKNKVIKQAEKQKNHYDSIVIYSKNKLIETIK